MAFQDTVRQYAKALARLGYCSYCFDFCGGSVIKGKSDGKTTDLSVLTEVQDLEAVIRYTQNLPYTGSELLLMGCSQGGFVSALTAAKHPGLADKLVLFYPALCIPDDARAGKMMFARFDSQSIPEKLRCGPMKLGRCYPAAVIDMDPYEEIKAYTGPVLLIHGTKDTIVRMDYRFIRQAKKYLYLEKLTPTILNDMVNAVYVHAPDKSSGHRVQDVTISYNYIGILPANLLYDVMNGKAA